MKVLVTGASGFLGRHVLERLAHHDIPAVALSRGPIVAPGAEALCVDLLDSPDLPSLVARAQATHLLHLAWYTEHGKYWTSPLNLRWVEASLRLVEVFCRAGGRHVVMAGTCAEYDWSHGYCREETTPLDPATLYGIAKDALRRLASAVCAAEGVPCAWGRVFYPHGAGESAQRLLPLLVDVFEGRRAPFPVNAAAYRDFLHAADVAEAFVALLRAEAQGVFNISSGEPRRIADLVLEVARVMGADPQPLLDLACVRPDEPPLLVGDNRRLKAVGWRQSLDFGQGIAHTIRSARSTETNRRPGA